MKYTDLFVKECFQEHEQWIKDNLLYETIVGSQAYGIANPDSDIDIVAIVMPLHQHLYPQSHGYILGYDQIPSFESKDIKGEKQRIKDSKGKDLEGQWTSLVRFFYLAGIKGSPNLIETLFVKRHLVTFSTDIGWMLRDNSQKFLSMRTFEAFKGYSFSQLHRIRNDVKRGKTENPKRQYLLDTWGYDLKMASHVLRLIDQLNQLLDTGELDLMNNREECKAMRRGEWGDFNRFETYVNDKVELLEKKALTQNTLPSKHRMAELKILLSNAIEEWYGSETNMQKQGTEYVSVKMLMDRLDRLEERFEKWLK